MFGLLSKTYGYFCYFLYKLYGWPVILYVSIGPLGWLDSAALFRLIQRFLHHGNAEVAFELADRLCNREPNEHFYYYLRAFVFCSSGQWEDGFEDISQALEIAPRETSYWVFRSDIFRSLEQYESAIADLQQSIRYSRDGQVTDLWYRIGQMYLTELSNAAEAKKALEETVKDKETAIPPYYYFLAQAHDQLLEKDDALQNLQICVDLWLEIEQAGQAKQPTVFERAGYSPEAAQLFLSDARDDSFHVPALCRFYYADRKYDEALGFINRALGYLPDNGNLLIERGKCHRLLENFELALADFERAAQLPCDTGKLLLERAHMWRLMDNEEAALADFLELKAMDPEVPFLDYWIAGSYVSLERMEDALQSFTAAIEIDPEDADCFSERAEVYESLGDSQAAEADYTRAIELRDDADGREKRAMFYYRLDRYDDALYDLQTALQFNPELLDEVYFRYLRGMIFMEIDHFQLAEDDFSAALLLEPERTVLYHRRASCLHAQERMQAAIADCDAGLEQDADFDALYWLRGLLYYKQGDYRKAARDALEYLRLNPEDTSANYNLGLIYIQLFEYKNALAQLSLVIARNPHYAEAYYQRAHVRERLLDFDRAAKDLANWAFFSDKDLTYEHRVAKILELDSFDELVIDDAIVQLQKLYGEEAHQLLH